MHTLLFISLFLVTDSQAVQSTLKMESPQHHFYEVELVFPKSKATSRMLKMATWAPGSYKIRDFAKHVEHFQALNGEGNPLVWQKTDKSSWQIQTNKGEILRVQYRIFANQFTVRTNYLNAFYGFIIPTAMFLYEPGMLERPYEIRVEPHPGWQVATPLEQTAGGSYRAMNWDELADSPFVFGHLRRHNFEINQIPHEWVILGDLDADEPNVVAAMQTIGTVVTDIFGSAPFDRYYYFSQFRLGPARGGLEHANSMMVQARSSQLRTQKGWDRFLSLLIHEYFHAWNVKAIRDGALVPFDYQREMYTDLLWLHEGWTSYYHTLLMRRAGFWDEKKLLESFAEDVDHYLQHPGAERQSLSDASFNAWIHQYQPSQTDENSHVSYYREGAMSGLAFDLLIRHKTKNERSLDSVMRALYQEYASQGQSISWEIVAKVLEQEAGASAVAFLESHVRHPNPLPMMACLEYAGLVPAPEEESPEDELAPFSPNPKVSMGLRTHSKGGALFIKSVRRGSAAWRGGLDFGDEILAVNDKRVTSKNFKRLLGWSRPGDEVQVLVSRSGKILMVSVTLEAKPKKLKLGRLKDTSALQNQIYESLFRPSSHKQNETQAEKS